MIQTKGMTKRRRRRKPLIKIFFPISVSCDEFILTGEKKKKNKIPELGETRPCVCVCELFSVL